MPERQPRRFAMPIRQRKRFTQANTLSKMNVRLRNRRTGETCLVGWTRQFGLALLAAFFTRTFGSRRMPPTGSRVLRDAEVVKVSKQGILPDAIADRDRRRVDPRRIAKTGSLCLGLAATPQFANHFAVTGKAPARP